MNEDSLFLDVELSKRNLISMMYPLLQKMADTAISIDPFEIHLILPPENDLKLTSFGKKLFVSFPLGFTIQKRDGIFSIEGGGKIRLDMVVSYDIDPYLTLKTNTELLDFDWIDEPKVQMGSLPIPIETVADCIIKKVKIDVVTSIDRMVEKEFSFRDLVLKQLGIIGNNILIHSKPNLYFNFELLQIQSTGLMDAEEKVHLHLWVEVASKISDEPILFDQTHDPTFHWLETEPITNQQLIEIQLSYQGLSKAIINEFNGQEIGGKKFEIESIHVRNTENLEIKVSIFSPIKGIITLTGMPLFDLQNQTVSIENLHTDISAESFIYKLSSPIIEKIVSSRIEQILPVDIRSTIKPYLRQMPTIKILDNQIRLTPNFDSITVRDIAWSASHVIIQVLLNRAEVDINI